MSIENPEPFGESQHATEESLSSSLEGLGDVPEQQELARLNRNELGVVAARIALPSKETTTEVGPDVYLG